MALQSMEPPNARAGARSSRSIRLSICAAKSFDIDRVNANRSSSQHEAALETLLLVAIGVGTGL
jgi:hypothetical protein